MRIGTQLYTVRNFTQTETEFAETIKKIAGMGMTGIQLSAVGAIGPAAVKQICDENGIEICVTHMPYDRILNDTKALITEHREMKCRYIGLGAMPAEYLGEPDGIYKFIAELKRPVAEIFDAGLVFAYHNHGFDLERNPSGNARLLEMLADGFPKNPIQFILDTYWLQYAGCDPCQWIKALAGRIDMIHLKDMMLFGGGHRMAPVMDGNMNFKAIMRAAREADVKWALIEQDDCYGENPFECLNRSFTNLRGLGYA